MADRIVPCRCFYCEYLRVTTQAFVNKIDAEIMKDYVPESSRPDASYSTIDALLSVQVPDEGAK